jgi:isoleucyl-tRNA synthetase
VTLAEGEYELRLVARAGGSAAPITGGVVLLDTALTPELVAEGLARDVVRVVQQARREAGLDVSDRVALRIASLDEVVAAVREHEAFVASEVLATSITYEGGGVGVTGFTGEVGDGETVTVFVERS